MKIDKSKIKKVVLAYSGGLDTCLLYTSDAADE